MILLDPPHPAGEKLWAIRAELAELEAEAERLRSAPLPLAEVEQRLVACLDVSSLDAALAPLRALFVPPGAEHIGRSFAHAIEIDANMLAALGRQDLERQARAYLASIADDAIAVGADEREKKLTRIAKKRAELEAAAERETMVLEDSGFFVVRPAELDARAILKLWEIES